MGSFNSSALASSVKLAIRSTIEAAIAGSVALAGAAAIFKSGAERHGLFIGGLSAWAASSISTTGLLVSKAHPSPKAFWWAFGGGMGLRLAVMAALMAWGYVHDGAVSQPALLLSYAFGVLFFLLLESRHIKIK